MQCERQKNFLTAAWCGRKRDYVVQGAGEWFYVVGFGGAVYMEQMWAFYNGYMFSSFMI